MILSQIIAAVTEDKFSVFISYLENFMHIDSPVLILILMSISIPFNPTIPQTAAGDRIEPPASVPKATGHKP